MRSLWGPKYHFRRYVTQIKLQKTCTNCMNNNYDTYMSLEVYSASTSVVLKNTNSNILPNISFWGKVNDKKMPFFWLNYFIYSLHRRCLISWVLYRKLAILVLSLPTRCFPTEILIHQQMKSAIPSEMKVKMSGWHLFGGGVVCWREFGRRT